MMPAKFDLYSAWIDPYFYVWGLVFAAALFSLVYSIRRYLELKNSEEDSEQPSEDQELPAQAVSMPDVPEQSEQPAAEEKTLVLPPSEQAWIPEDQQEQPAEQPAEEPVPGELQQPEQQEPPQYEEQPAPEQPAYAEADAPAEETDHTRAENFVRGIYAGISDLDERMKTIEQALSKSRINNDFAVKFLEDIIQDFDSLEKSKIKARIEYLVSDLKK